MNKPNWHEAIKGIVLYTVLVLGAGVAISLFDRGQVGACADLIMTALFLTICGFLGGVGASYGNEAATGAVVGLGSLIPNSVISVFANRFNLVAFFISILLFSFLGALGGAIAKYTRQPSSNYE